MSVEPWMLAWPRSAWMPPPGRPMLPSSSCRMLAAADVLDAVAVLGPADRVDERGGALRPGVLGQAPAHLGEHVRRDAADPLDHLRACSGRSGV